MNDLKSHIYITSTDGLKNYWHIARYVLLPPIRLDVIEIVISQLSAIYINIFLYLSRWKVIYENDKKLILNDGKTRHFLKSIY